MAQTLSPGQVIILNGVPRSGKSSIVEVIQDTFDGVWMNLGVDGFMQMTPARHLPGMGLRRLRNEGEKDEQERRAIAGGFHKRSRSRLGPATGARRNRAPGSGRQRRRAFRLHAS
jgi:hypothetical protein